ncbi:checkpoint protein HUS1 isoform X2 [Sitophilus oryzae]|uniref:Checkpoint protein n=1 Tax=Sitophilus oryzae TaxID=7048 RepID=A0A6J2YPB1_SITOR|nr:checkpoint protein HUS1 isoform X2 [Sitophilus oryzae]
MQFRALIVDNAAMKDFLILSLSKFSKTCVLRLTSTKIYFIVSEEENGPRQPLVWCELPINYYFREYNIVGVSSSYNEIYLELSTVLLARSCTVIKQDIISFKIKLTHKETPCLTLEMEMAAGDIATRQCVHDIPVEVISRKYWESYEEPHFTDFHVSIQMPNLKSVRNIVERMKSMSHTLTVSANKDGKLNLSINTSTVKLAAHFPNLNVNSFVEGNVTNCSNEEIKSNSVSSTIDIKKFIMFLSGMQLNNCQAVCNIVQGKMVKLYMEQPGALLLQIFLTEMTI